MKIVLFDFIRKFTDDLINHWRELGHEVKIDRYFDPKLMSWADIVFFEFVDNSLMRASDPLDSMWQQIGGTQLKPPKVVARAHDIDIWTGNLAKVKWNFVDDLVYVSDTMKDICGGDFEHVKKHVVYHGIDVDRWTFKERKPGNQIALIGNINHQKHTELALQVLAEYPGYELTIVGTGWRNWQQYYFKHFARENNFKINFIDRVESIDEFLEGIDYLLLTSMKEAFSFIVGEAAAKGVKPLVHNFYGAKKLWPEKWIWNKVSDLKDMFNDYNSKEYRDYVQNTYPLKKMLSEYDKIMFN